MQILNRSNSVLFVLLAGLISLLSSCLKDKDFEDGVYQSATGPGTEGIEYVSIPKARAPQVIAIEAKSEAQDVSLFEAVYDYINAASTDIQVTMAVNNTLVSAENPNTVVLPTDAYSLPSLTLTIPAGQRLSDALIMKMTTDNLPDLTKVYGIGFTIQSVSKAGVGIPSNLKNVLYKFTLKNKYDGRYTLNGYHNRDPYTFPYQTEIHLVTVGPDEVEFYWPLVSSVGHPIGIGAGNSMSWYGAAIAPVIVFDLDTDLVADVYNKPPNATPITMFTGPGSRLSKWDPATRNITVDWNYSNNALRAFFDDLTYIGPRP